MDRPAPVDAAPPASSRPRLNLAKRTGESPKASLEHSDVNARPPVAKSNPFGSARAVDTASKLAEAEKKAESMKVRTRGAERRGWESQATMMCSSSDANVGAL